MTARASSRTVWAGVAALYVGLTLLYAWPLLRVLGSALPNDAGDPGLNAWIIWWNAHAVPLTSRWWDAPIFFPLHGAFALSETYLALAPLTTPLQWLGATPVVAYNIAFLLTYPAAALGAHALAHRLTGRHDAALIAGLAFGFSPYRASQIPHLQLLVSCWMPLALLCLHRFVATHRRRDLVLFGVCWLLNGIATGYYLVFFAVLAGLWMAWFVRSRADWARIVATMAIASLPIVPLVIGYQHYQGALGLSRSPDEIDEFSADLSAVWAASPTLWLPSRWTIEPKPEGELYPGATIVVLTLVGAFVAWRRQPASRWQAIPALFVGVAALAAIGAVISWRIGPWHFKVIGLSLSGTHPARGIALAVWLLLAAVMVDRRVSGAWRRQSALLFYAAAAFVMLLFALGPTAKVFGEPFLFNAPYTALMALPGGHSLRVPARFAMLVALCLSVGGALAFAHLTRRRAAMTGLACVIGLAVALEGWMLHLQTAEVPPVANLAGLDPKAAVLELPGLDLYADTAAMLRSTVHGHPVVNGFSGYVPPHYDFVELGLTAFDPTIVTAFQQFGPLIVVVDRERDADGRYAAFMDHIPEARFALRTPVGVAYILPARPLPASTETDRLLPIAHIEVSEGVDVASMMTDGKLATQWQTLDPQRPGVEVTISLDQAAAIGRIEMDLARYRVNYPRGLRVTVADEGSAPVVVFDGSTLGATMLAALRDHDRMPLTIHLPGAPHGRRIVMTLTGSDRQFYWSIAELRVYGR